MLAFGSKRFFVVFFYLNVKLFDVDAFWFSSDLTTTTTVTTISGQSATASAANVEPARTVSQASATGGREVIVATPSMSSTLKTEIRSQTPEVFGRSIPPQVIKTWGSSPQSPQSGNDPLVPQETNGSTADKDQKPLCYCPCSSPGASHSQRSANLEDEESRDHGQGSSPLIDETRSSSFPANQEQPEQSGAASRTQLRRPDSDCANRPLQQTDREAIERCQEKSEKDEWNKELAQTRQILFSGASGSDVRVVQTNCQVATEHRLCDLLMGEANTCLLTEIMSRVEEANKCCTMAITPAMAQLCLGHLNQDQILQISTSQVAPEGGAALQPAAASV